MKSMPADKTFSSSALSRRSRSVGKRARSEREKPFPLTAVAPSRVRDKSSELCRHSDELLRRSHELRERLRTICHAR